MKTSNIRFWVNPTYIVKMMGRYLEDGCEFDLYITCERTRFGTQNYRGVTIGFPDGCSHNDIISTLAWVVKATDGNLIFINEIKKIEL